MPYRTPECIPPLLRAGISPDDADALRRIAMQLRRWHDLECGTEDGAIERPFAPADKTPYWTVATGTGGRRSVKTADRETGARKRLAKIMSRYPTLRAYIQGDPRGAALWILRPGDVPEDENVESYYSRGIAVYR